MKKLTSKKLPVVAGAIFLGCICVGLAVITLPKIQNRDEKNAASASVEISPVPNSPSTLPSALPVATATLSATASPKPSVKPSPKVSPTPKVSPSPSTSPSPTSGADLAYDGAVYVRNLSKNQAFDVTQTRLFKIPSGDTLNIFYMKIKNQGNVPAQQIDIVMNSDGTEYPRLLDDNIDPGRTNEFGFNMSLDTHPGHHNVRIKINPTKKIPETDYSNNEVFFEYDVE